MAELSDHVLLLRRIAFSESSWVLHVLSREHGQLHLLAKGARRQKSALRAELEPLHVLHMRWRPARRPTAMGMVLESAKQQAILSPDRSLLGLNVLAIVAQLLHDSSAYPWTLTALAIVQHQAVALAEDAALWYVFKQAGWVGDMQHCWRCDMALHTKAYWYRGSLHCQACSGAALSLSLYMAMQAVLQGHAVSLTVEDRQLWRKISLNMLKIHGLKHDLRQVS